VAHGGERADQALFGFRAIRTCYCPFFQWDIVSSSAPQPARVMAVLRVCAFAAPVTNFTQSVDAA